MDILEHPRKRFEELLDARRGAAREQERRHHLFGYVRLVLGALLAYSGWLALGMTEGVPWPFLVSLAVFVTATAMHSRVIRQLEMARRSVAHFERGLARLAGDFSKATARGDGACFDVWAAVAAAWRAVFSNGPTSPRRCFHVWSTCLGHGSAAVSSDYLRLFIQAHEGLPAPPPEARRWWRWDSLRRW